MNYDGCKRKFDILKYIRKCGPATSKTSETTQKSVNSFFARKNVGASIVEDDSNPKKKARKS